MFEYFPYKFISLFSRLICVLDTFILQDLMCCGCVCVCARALVFDFFLHSHGNRNILLITRKILSKSTNSVEWSMAKHNAHNQQWTRRGIAERERNRKRERERAYKHDGMRLFYLSLVNERNKHWTKRLACSRGFTRVVKLSVYGFGSALVFSLCQCQQPYYHCVRLYLRKVNLFENFKYVSMGLHN